MIGKLPFTKFFVHPFNSYFGEKSNILILDKISSKRIIQDMPENIIPMRQIGKIETQIINGQIKIENQIMDGQKKIAEKEAMQEQRTSQNKADLIKGGLISEGILTLVPLSEKGAKSLPEAENLKKLFDTFCWQLDQSQNTF